MQDDTIARWSGGMAFALALCAACGDSEGDGTSSGGAAGSSGSLGPGASTSAVGSGSSASGSTTSGPTTSGPTSSGAGGSGAASSTASGDPTADVSAGSGGSSGIGGAAPGSYSLDFATATIENPLSAGGVWTNNTQGTGGNVAPGNFTSMRVDLASDGATRIAFDTHGGIEYDDSFAFVPGFDGDQYVEAVIYKEAGYNPNASGSNHELELILGCSSASGTRIWNEFLFNSGGGVDIIYLDGGPSDFTSISNVGGIAHIPEDGDVVRAEKIGDVLNLYVNGELWVGYDGADSSKIARGDGAGIAAFIRPGATHDKYGFRAVEIGTL